MDITEVIEGLTTKLDQSLTNMDSRIKAVEEAQAALAAPKRATATADAQESSIKQAFYETLAARTPTPEYEEYIKLAADTFRIGVDPAGGFLCPEEIRKEIIRYVRDLSPVRQYATVIDTQSESVLMARETDEDLDIGIYGEQEELTGSGTPGDWFKTIRIQTYKMRTRLVATNDLLSASWFDIEQYIRERVAEKFARQEGKLFITGTGADQPEGLLGSSELKYVPSGSASALTIDSLIKAKNTLNETYQRNAVWLMNQATLTWLEQQVDDVGRPIWRMDYVAGEPKTLLGKPFVICPDMPDIGSNAYPVVYGDLKQAYRIVDRGVLQFLVDPYTGISSDVTVYWAKRYLGAGVVNPNAYVAVKIATS